MKNIKRISCIILVIALTAPYTGSMHHAQANISTINTTNTTEEQTTITSPLPTPNAPDAMTPNPPQTADHFNNFKYSDDYEPGQFSDVGRTQWYSQYVEDAYNYGLIRGRTANQFSPGGLLTIGEAVTLAARLRSIYHTGKAEFAETAPYYEAYAEYAIQHGIINGQMNYVTPINRAQFAGLMYNALPPEAYPAINAIPDYAINDVIPGSEHSAAIYALYRAGILSGSDQYGTFYPNQHITRAEVSTVLVRVLHPASRISIKLPDWIPAEVIYQRSVDAVVTIETFNAASRSIRTGSGFFITANGHVITALHVLDNAESATVTLLNGEVYPVLGVLASSEEFNVALLSVDAADRSFNFLNIADSSLIEIGNTLYSLGSPLNYTNTISEGVISHTSRELDDQTLIMFTAPISFGSGGSPILNTRGQVICIASLSYTSGQNLNLGIPSNHISALTPGKAINLSEFQENR